MRHAVILGVLAGCMMPGTAQQQAPEAKGPVVLQASAAVQKGVAAFPRLAAVGEVSAAVARKVNASLARLDGLVAKAAKECRRDGRETSAQMGDPFWERSMEVAMQGPRFLSLVAADSHYCGGVNQDNVKPASLPLVYDLRTGLPVNWLNYLPAGANSILGESDDGATVGEVVWPALSKLARNQSDAKCKELYAADAEVRFVLWLQARGGNIVAEPLGIDHLGSDCTVDLEISVAEARKMGVHGEVLDALEAAQKLQ